MSLLDRVRNLFTSKENRAEKLLNDPNVMTLFSGVNTSSQGALSISAVYACVRVITQAISTVPFVLYEKDSEGNRREAVEHPLHKILHDEPNRDMTSMTYREVVMNHLLLRGVHYSEVVWDNSGNVVEVYPLDPDQIKVERNEATKELQYRHLPTGKVLPKYRILHIPGLGWDGINSYSPLALARNSLSLAQSVEKYGNNFFTNGINPTGFIEVPDTMSDAAYQRFVKDLKGKYGGVSNSGRLLILENGAKYSRVSIAPEDAQFLQTRKFSVQDICRWFGVPPYMVGDLEKLNYNNIEQQSIDLVRYTFRPWAVRLEQHFNRSFIPSKKRGQMFCELKLDGLLRGDAASRWAYYTQGHDRGILSADEIRQLENLPAQPDNMGKEYLVPLNYTTKTKLLTAYQPIEEEEPTEEPQKEEKHSFTVDQRTSLNEFKSVMSGYKPRIRKYMTMLVGDVYTEASERFEKHFSERGVSTFMQWMERYLKELQQTIVDSYTPIAEEYALRVMKVTTDELGTMMVDITPFRESYVNGFAKRYVRKTEALFNKYLEEGMDNETVQQKLEQYRDKMVGELTEEETVRGGNSYRRAIYKKVGVTRLKWSASGETCPLCRSLDGRVVGIEEAFINEGDEMDFGENKTISRKNFSTPPIHAGCECSIVAEK
jgi:HK97 family phage portal protein